MIPSIVEESSHYLIAFDQAIFEAERDGFTVIRGDERTLLFDLDSAQDIAHFDDVFPLLVQHLPCEIVDRWPSKSGMGGHVIVKSERDLPVTERLLIQAALGSDRIHELLSLVTGVWQDNPRPTVLFKPPAKPTAPQPFIIDDDAPF